MGCCCSKVPAVRFTDEAEKMAAGTVMIHDALRAGMTSIIRHAQEGVAADKRDAFLDYVNLFLLVLHIHHHDEDEVVFPWVHTKAPGMLDQQAAEHKELEADLERMKEATKAGNVALIGEICTRVQTFLLPHLMQEQTKVTAEWMRTNFTNAEIKRHHKELMAAVQAAAPPEESFPWVVYHIKPETRGVLELPGFVQNLLFPKWAAVHAPAWEFAPYATQRGGKYTFA